MSETYILRLFTADREPAGPSGVASPPDGHVRGTVVRVVTGRRLPFRDDRELIAALGELAGDTPPAHRAGPGAEEAHDRV